MADGPRLQLIPLLVAMVVARVLVRGLAVKQAMALDVRLERTSLVAGAALNLLVLAGNGDFNLASARTFVSAAGHVVILGLPYTHKRRQ